MTNELELPLNPENLLYSWAPFHIQGMSRPRPPLLAPPPPSTNMLVTKCGAWGCFDEFNRLKEDQLSAISQQIQLIQDAIKAKRPCLK